MLQIVVAGRLTKDAILRYTANDSTAVLNFTVATDVGYGDRKHGVFIECSLWGKRGEALDPYLKKGKQVTVIGEGDLRKYTTDNGSGANITCKVQEVAMQGGGEQTDQAPKQAEGFREKPKHSQPDANPNPGFDDDEDIPF